MQINSKFYKKNPKPQTTTTETQIPDYFTLSNTDSKLLSQRE